LYTNPIIKKFVAGLMLLLFAVSIMPKQFLHEKITGHKHTYEKPGDSVTFKPVKNNFQCSWHNDVVESPFTNQADQQLPHPFVAHSSYFNHYILSYYSPEYFFSSLRGPPSMA
jgi:hypothetical protein